MTVLIIVVFALLMVAMDRALRNVDHLSAFFAPLMVVVSFGQTLSLLLDLDVTWPPRLRALMEMFGVLNINLELIRPE